MFYKGEYRKVVNYDDEVHRVSLVTRSKVSNYEKVAELIQRGLDNTEIEKVIGLAMQTIRNYRSKSNKQLQIAS